MKRFLLGLVVLQFAVVSGAKADSSISPSKVGGSPAAHVVQPEKAKASAAQVKREAKIREIYLSRSGGSPSAVPIRFIVEK